MREDSQEMNKHGWIIAIMLSVLATGLMIIGLVESPEEIWVKSFKTRNRMKSLASYIQYYSVVTGKLVSNENWHADLIIVFPADASSLIELFQDKWGREITLRRRTDLQIGFELVSKGFSVNDLDDDIVVVVDVQAKL
jgi:hypothetical protein